MGLQDFTKCVREDVASVGVSREREARMVVSSSR